jgi:hypothetical protein
LPRNTSDENVVKPIGANLSDAGSPGPGGHAKGVASKPREEFVIVPMDDDFDIDAVFRSEHAPAAEALPAEAPPVQAPIEIPVPAPLAVESVVRAEPEEPARQPAPIAGPTLVPAPVIELSLTADVTPFDRSRTPALSIADLIDNHVHLEWQEAVAIAQHLCRVMSRDPGANVHRSLVEPWNVEITDAGEVHVLPGGSSSDPLVKQVGRVLRVLLQDSIAPAELRLVASQASFEVPVYSSVDELSAALRHFERLSEAGDSEAAIRAAFNRGLEAKYAGLPPTERVVPASGQPAAELHPHPPAKRAVRKAPALARPAPPVRKRSGVMAVAAGAITVAVAAAAAVVITRFADVSSLWSFAPAPAPRQEAAPARPQPPAPPAQAEAPPEPVKAPPELSARAVAPERVAPPASRPAARSRDLSSPARGFPPAPALPSARGPEPAARTAAVAGDSIDASIRRASALLAEGRNGEAAVIFDGIVMRSPLVQLDPARYTPETLAAFQTSKRLLLPAMARRYYQEARVAYDAGDFSMTLTKGERALALLRDADIDPSDADLNNEVSNLMAMATSARALEEARIYTSADRDVTPPRPVGRQLSTASLSGRAPLTGRLELVVSRSGEVETVKLETPVNGYHDRMIVSAAKAWHYRPATKKGRPVRYSMVMSITLPDF